jgi:hypothetical protein
MSHEQPKISARKAKREGPLRIPLRFEEVISHVLKVKPERKPAIKKGKKGTRVCANLPRSYLREFVVENVAVQCTITV